MISKKIRTEEEQSKLAPDEVVEILKRGNNGFTCGRLAVKSNRDRMRDAVKGQHPSAVILSCIDSRVPVEEIFQCGIGDIFVVRIAGNIVNSDVLGSLEYACKVSGAKLAVVMGHEHCGAVKAAIEGTTLGNITGLLSKIKPAVNQAKINFIGEPISSNKEFVDLVCHTNVEIMINKIRTESPVLKKQEDRGEIKIVGAIYRLESGKVEFL